MGARRFLKYSYIFAWNHNHHSKNTSGDSRDIFLPFSIHQATLELLTERLSHMTHRTDMHKLYASEGLARIRNFFRGMQFHAFSMRKYIQRIESLEIVLSNCNQGVHLELEV